MIIELIGLLVLVSGIIFMRPLYAIWVGLISLYLLLITVYGSTPIYIAAVYWVIFLAIVIVTGVEKFRLRLISKPFFHYFKKALPPISKTEQEALSAGDVWWEGELFCGNPDWQKLHDYPKPTLSVEEQAFLDNQVETLCAMLNDWNIVYKDHDLPPSVWDYLKREKFFGLVIEKKYGGLGFSALGHSAIVCKIATRCLSAAINTMVPNSLGPGELLHRYGTTAQKDYYLPRLVDGKEIPCFGLTSLDAGSDAGAMTDFGVVSKQFIDGKEVLGIKLNFSKRYITLAPVATVIGLAFKLYDPEHFLGNKEELGITLALLAADMPGITIGKRHFPMNLAFMNGPIQGENVFITLDAIIGGPDYIGQGWRMLMECLSIGRSISLPALSVAATMVAYRSSSAYAAIRQQFKMSIGKFEGVAQSLAQIGAYTYLLKATQRMTCGAVDLGFKPSVASAIAKYHCTELGRVVLNNAVDIHGGRAVQNGPNNYLANVYFGIPVSITVEGANILTRNLIIFGQGAIRCHPYILSEMQAVQAHDLKLFDNLLLKHITYTASNIVRTFTFGLTNAWFIRSPQPGILSKYYRQLTRMSAALAMVSDIAMLTLGGNLKRKESLSARLGDVLSALYLSSAALKYYLDEGMQENEIEHLCWTLDQQLADIQRALDEFFDNFSPRWLSRALRFITFPWGRSYKKPTDRLTVQVVETMLASNELRDRLTDLCYIGDPNDPLAVLEQAFKDQPLVEPLRRKLYQAIKAGKINAMDKLEQQLLTAISMNILTEQEAQQLTNFEKIRVQALAVDEFSAEYFNKG